MYFDYDNFYDTKKHYYLSAGGNYWTNKYSSRVSNGRGVWTDGTNLYFNGDYVLDKSTSTWNTKTWNNPPKGFSGEYIWTDGDNIYLSNNNIQYVLNKSTSTWSTKTWSGLTNFNGQYVWTDGDNIYYSNASNQYVLNKSTSIWSSKAWNGDYRYDTGWGISSALSGEYIWTDGTNIYLSYLFYSTCIQCILDKATSTWNTKTWNGYNNIDGQHVWTDGTNIYYSYNGNNYILTE